MRDTQWSRADRAAVALSIYHDAMTGHEPFMGKGYGDEGSDEFDEAVMSLLVDLKHLLWRVGGPAYVLEDLVQTAIDRWSEECEELPEGGDEEPCEWFVNNAATPSWCCNTHMYDGTGDYPATEAHPDDCPFADREDDNTTLDPTVPDPADAPSYKNL